MSVPGSPGGWRAFAPEGGAASGGAGGASGADQAPIRLLLVEDHAVVRAGLAALLDRVPGFKVVGEAGTVADGVVAAAQLEPDVVLMDVRLPDGTGMDACREIRSARQATHVLMLTSYADDDAVLTSLMASAAGYLLKEADAARLVEAIKLVAAGGVLFDPGVAQSMMSWLQRHAAPVAPPAASTVPAAVGSGHDPVSASPATAGPVTAIGGGALRGEIGAPQGSGVDLTDDERRILSRLAAGETNREIAAGLHFSEHTVKHYVSRLMRKLQVARRSEAAALASRFLPKT